MRESKVINVSKYNRDDEIDGESVRPEGLQRKYRSDVRTRNVGIQYNSETHKICTCRNVLMRRNRKTKYFSGFPKQVFAYQGSRSSTDIGVGDVRTFPRSKVRRLYVPETEDRGAGNSTLSYYNKQRNNYDNNICYYDHKQTASICVGGPAECSAEIISVKLSPIVLLKSGTTSPQCLLEHTKNNVDKGNNTCEKYLVNMSTQIENIQSKTKDTRLEGSKVSTNRNEPKASVENREKRVSRRALEAEMVFSSDSLVQHVHNLENPSLDAKPIPMQSVIDPTENQMEREYRKMFSVSNECKENENKDMDMKSTSVLRRRFEALRRGLAKKGNSSVINNMSHPQGVPVSESSRKDVSITSDPPSLESRSFSSNTPNSPDSFMDKNTIPPKTKNEKAIVGKGGTPFEARSSDCQGVEGMFKLWGRKFDFTEPEADANKAAVPLDAINIIKPPKQKVKITAESDIRKGGKKFNFFKKKVKVKSKPSYKEKKSVTAGRCEVRDGLKIKIGAAKTNPVPKVKTARNKKSKEQTPQEYKEMLRNAWLQQCLEQTIDSRNSVKLRWCNKSFGTSSSTIFEIMNNVYRHTGVVFKSKSEIITSDSSNYRPFKKQRVNFVQNIEAWILQKVIPDRRDVSTELKNIHFEIGDRKFFDKNAKARHMEALLRLYLQRRQHITDTKCLEFDLPKGFFSELNSDSAGPIETSNEEVSKIVEYDTSVSSTIFRKTYNSKTRDSERKRYENELITPEYRDVIIQSSKVNVLKRCKAIEVGLITHNDFNRLKRSIFNMLDDYTDDEYVKSFNAIQNKKYAQMYLRDYYRHWISLGVDHFSCIVSDSHLQCYSNSDTVNSDFNQEDPIRSCPNIFDNYRAVKLFAPCSAQCCSECSQVKAFKRSVSNSMLDVKQMLPKDTTQASMKSKKNESSNRSKFINVKDHSSYTLSSYKEIEGLKPKYNGKLANTTAKGHYYKSVFISDRDKANARIDNDEQSNNKTCYLRSDVEGNIKARMCKVLYRDNTCEPNNAPVPVHVAVESNLLSSCHEECCMKMKRQINASTRPNYLSCEPPEGINGVRYANHETTTCLSNFSPVDVFSNLSKGKLIGKEKTSPQSESPILRCRDTSPITPPYIPCPKSKDKTSPQRYLTPKQEKSPSLLSSGSPDKIKAKSPTSSRLSITCICPLQETSPTVPSPTTRDIRYPINQISIKNNAKTSSCEKKSKESSKCPCFPKNDKCLCNCPKKIPPCAVCHKTVTRDASCAANKSCPGSQLEKKKQKRCLENLLSKFKSLRQSASTSSSDTTKKQANKTESTCSTASEQIPCYGCKNTSSETFLCPNRNETSNQPSKSSLEYTNSSETCLSPKNKKNSSEQSPSSSPTPLSCPCKLLSPKNREAKQPPPQLQSASSSSLLTPCLPPASKPIPPAACIKSSPTPATCPPICKQSEENKSGVFLKKLPKLCPENCKCKDHSDDSFIIKIKKTTPSTEEIRENVNIKVKDETGRTIYERKDYHAINCESVYDKIYHNSNVHPASSTSINKMELIKKSSAEINEVRSSVSLSNVIEINLNLKIPQGDQNIETNLGNDEVCEKCDIKPNKQDSQQVLMLNDVGEKCVDYQTGKNGVDIKIVIKNYKPNQKSTDKTISTQKEFSQKVLHKFQTVSTGYSDLIQKPVSENVFSVHTRTTNLLSSREESATGAPLSNEDKHHEEYAEKLTVAETVSNSEKSGTTKSESRLEYSPSSKRADLEKIQNCLYKDRTLVDKTLYSSTDVDDHDIVGANTSDDPNTYGASSDIVTNGLTHAEKKYLMKKVLSKSTKCNRIKNRKDIRQLKDMLKLILTSDSSQDDIAAARDKVNDSYTMKANYSRDTYSKTSCCKPDSSVVLTHQESIEKNGAYPTGDISECSARETTDCTTEEEENGDNSCVCSRLAERLNICSQNNNSCFCREKRKDNKEIACDLRMENDLLFSYNKFQYIDVETQHSKYLCSGNVSVHSKAVSGVSFNGFNLPNFLDNCSKAANSSQSTKAKPHHMYNCNRNTCLGISDDGTVYVLNSKPISVSVTMRKEVNDANNEVLKRDESYSNRPSNVLQCYETKKAVLQIYAKKDEGGHFVSKLPKYAEEDEFGQENFDDDMIFDYIIKTLKIMNVK